MGRARRSRFLIPTLAISALVAVTAVWTTGALAQTDPVGELEPGGGAEASGTAIRDPGGGGRVIENPGGDLPPVEPPVVTPDGGVQPPTDTVPDADADADAEPGGGGGSGGGSSGGGSSGGGSGGGGLGGGGTGTQQVPGVDLVTTKTDSPDPVTAGNNLTYTITVTNDGDTDATNVVVQDQLPLVALISATPSQGTCSGMAMITCTLGTIASGASATITIVVQVLPSTAAGTVLSNTAFADSPETEGNQSNNADTETTTVTTAADLAVTKSDAPDPVPTGANLTYSIGAINLGPSDAQNVTLTDVLPAGTTFVSLNAPAGWTTITPPVGGTGTVTATTPTLTANSGPVFTLVVNVNASSGTLINNTATISSVTTDPDTANNAATTQTAVGQSADLSVTKTDSPDPVTAGNNLTYTITVTNGGPDNASNVSLSDTVPTGTTFVSFTSPGGWTATAPPAGGTGTVSATNPSFAAGSAVFTLVVNVNPSTTTTISNTASVSSPTFDPDTNDRSDTETTAVSVSADLSVTKTDSPDPVTAGNNLTYTITVDNAGPSDDAVQLTDGIPTGTTFVSFTAPAGWMTITPPVGGTGGVTATKTVAPSEPPAVFTLVVNVNANVPQGGTITNLASVGGPGTDPNPGNDTDTETTAVIASADLSVVKTDSPDPVNAGSNLTYSITLSNAGPSDAQSVTLTDVVPAGTTFVSLTQNTGPAFTLTTPPAGGTGTVTATRATFAAGATATFTLVVNVNATVPQGGTITNTVDATSTTTDPDLTDNSDTEVTAVNASADLSVTKTDAPDPVTAGTGLTYSITLSNAGPSDAQSVTLTDVVPAGTTFVSFTQNTGPAFTIMTPPAGGTGTVTATSATLTAGATATFTMVVSVDSNVPQGGTITNTVNATTTTIDPTAANNSDTETTAVNALADLSVTKADAPDPVTAGTELTYTITVTNAGPSDTGGDVTVTDPLPPGTALVSATPSQGSCGAPSVTCDLGPMAMGDTATITVVVHVDPAMEDGATISNMATVSSPATDPTSTNNAATADTAVTTSADVSLTKTAEPDPVTAGENVTYTITATNDGPSDAQDITVTDELPAGTSFVSATPSQGTCSGTTTVTCDLGMIAVGESATITLVVQVDPSLADGTIITNVAAASSAEVTVATADPTLDNNTATASVTVRGLPAPAEAASPAATPAASPSPAPASARTATVAIAVRAVPRFTG
jgi:large repetitive protein